MKKIQVRCEIPNTNEEVWMDFLEIDGEKYRLVDESECKHEFNNVVIKCNELIKYNEPEKIEKLEDIDNSERKWFETSKPDMLQVWDKINELVEAVNRLKK